MSCHVMCSLLRERRNRQNNWIKTIHSDNLIYRWSSKKHIQSCWNGWRAACQFWKWNNQNPDEFLSNEGETRSFSGDFLSYLSLLTIMTPLTLETITDWYKKSSRCRNDFHVFHESLDRFHWIIFTENELQAIVFTVGSLMNHKFSVIDCWSSSKSFERRKLWKWNYHSELVDFPNSDNYPDRFLDTASKLFLTFLSLPGLFCGLDLQ